MSLNILIRNSNAASHKLLSYNSLMGKANSPSKTAQKKKTILLAMIGAVLIALWQLC